MAGLEGQVLDRYRIEELVGQGGMASVYRATELVGNHTVAVKVMSPTIAGDRQFVRRFRREAGILKKLKHPNIVSVLDYGESEGVVYLVMPFVVGETLYDRVNRKRVTDSDAAKWIGQVAKALAFAHNQGVIHRDVKPSNILIDGKGNAHLTDFGLARLIEDPNSLTGSMLLGTPAFISPEQAKGQRLGPASDQYSLGVVCFLLATGRLPFESDSPMATILMHLQDPVPMPRLFRPDLPEAVERVILKAMAKDSEDRFANVLEMSRALQAALAGKPVNWGEGSVGEIRGETPSWVGARSAEASAGRPAGRSVGRLFAGIFGISLLAAAAFFLVPRLVGGDQAVSTPTSAPALTASLTPPPTLAVLARQTPPAGPTPTATAVLSAGCTMLRMFGFQRQGNEVSWSVANEGDSQVSFANVELGFSKDNAPEVRLGGELLVRADPASSGETVVVAAFEQVKIDPERITQLTIAYPWDIGESGNAIRLTFDNGCVLETEW